MSENREERRLPDAVAVEVRVADAEPVASLIAGVGEALEQFGALDDSQMEALPLAARLGIARLFAARDELDGNRPAPPRRDPEGGYRGAVIIEWPPPAKHNGAGPLRACLAAVYDAFTGDSFNPKMISTVTEITVRAPAEGFVTADLTMFADEDGNPVYDGMPNIRDGEIITAMFSFIVAEMRVRYA